MLTVLEDTRSVVGIAIDSVEVAVTETVGQTCDEIVAYGENGEMAHVPWFAVVKDGQVIRRVNGKFVVEVYYGVVPREGSDGV